LIVKRALFFLNAAFATAILDLISQVHFPSFVNILHKYLKEKLLKRIYNTGEKEMKFTFRITKATI
jgi:hypothetical protein